MIRKQKKILSFLGVIFAAGILLTLPGISPSYAFDELPALLGVLVPAFFAFVISTALTIIIELSSPHDQQSSSFFANPQVGFAAIKNTVTENNQLLDDGDFGLDAQTNDPDYGLKRIADDIQDTDFGLEAIDDEVEVIDARIDKQVSRQRVDLSVIKSESFYYVHTSESGVPVDVEFIELKIIKKGDEISLTPDQFSITPMLSGIYQMEIDVNGKVDGIIIKVKHEEPNIVHVDLGINKEAHHFGQILVEEGIEKSSVQ